MRKCFTARPGCLKPPANTTPRLTWVSASSGAVAAALLQPLAEHGQRLVEIQALVGGHRPAVERHQAVAGGGTCTTGGRSGHPDFAGGHGRRLGLGLVRRLCVLGCVRGGFLGRNGLGRFGLGGVGYGGFGRRRCDHGRFSLDGCPGGHGGRRDRGAHCRGRGGRSRWRRWRRGHHHDRWRRGRGTAQRCAQAEHAGDDRHRGHHAHGDQAGRSRRAQQLGHLAGHRVDGAVPAGRARAYGARRFDGAQVGAWLGGHRAAGRVARAGAAEAGGELAPAVLQGPIQRRPVQRSPFSPDAPGPCPGAAACRPVRRRRQHQRRRRRGDRHRQRMPAIGQHRGTAAVPASTMVGASMGSGVTSRSAGIARSDRGRPHRLEQPGIDVRLDGRGLVVGRHRGHARARRLGGQAQAGAAGAVAAALGRGAPAGSGGSPTSRTLNDSASSSPVCSRRRSLDDTSSGAVTASMRDSSAARSRSRTPQISVTHSATSRLVAGGAAVSSARANASAVAVAIFGPGLQRLQHHRVQRRRHRRVAVAGRINRPHRPLGAGRSPGP